MKSKERVFQIAVWGLCVVLAIALIILVNTDRKKNQERIYQAQMEAQLQNGDAETSGATDNESEKKIAAVYEDLMSSLNMNSFVCWGDNEMVGNAGASLPRSLGETINGHFLDLLSDTFGEVIERENKTVPPIAVNNMGTSNEGMKELLVRTGVDELEVGEWALISGEREPINIVLRNSNSGSTLYFALQKEAELGWAEISGVKGVLTMGDGNYDEDHPRLAFLRDRAGDSFQVGLGTNIQIESATKYIGNIPVFFFEDDSADTDDSIDEFISDLDRLVRRYTEIKDEDGESSSEELPYVIICTVDEESELDESLKEAFGDRYIRHGTYADEMTECRAAN